MLKITRIEIKNFLEGIKWTVENSTDKFYIAGAYIFKDKINLFSSYHGHSIDGNYYNKLYVKCILLDSTIEMYLENEYDLDTAIEVIIEDIEKMIEEYKEELEDEE